MNLTEADAAVYRARISTAERQNAIMRDEIDRLRARVREAYGDKAVGFRDGWNAAMERAAYAIETGEGFDGPLDDDLFDKLAGIIRGLAILSVSDGAPK